MRATKWILPCLVVVMALALQPGWGTQIRCGRSVAISSSTTIPDDLAISGTNVTVDGTIKGDLLAVGSNVNTAAKVGQSALVAGSIVNISGTAAQNLRAAGSVVTISGKTAQNATLAGSSVTLTPMATVGRDLSAAGSVVSISGKVARDANLAGALVTINGQIGGNVAAYPGNLQVGPEAVIKGNLVYASANNASIAPGAKILGRVIHNPAPRMGHRGHGRFRRFLWVVGLIGAFIVGVLMLALCPQMTQTVVDLAKTSPWWSILIGLIVFIVTPAVIFALGITVVGIPLCLIVLAIYLILLYLSVIVAAMWLGRLIFSGSTTTSEYVKFLVGIVILWIAVAIPWLGYLVKFLALFLGLGAFSSVLYNARRSGTRPTVE
jgi:cytoskeletal protein CcmA (bactofilin family)